MLASVVESGTASLEAGAEALSDAEAELGASEELLPDAAEPPQPASTLQAMAAHSSSERIRVYFNFIAKSSLTRQNAGASRNDTP